MVKKLKAAALLVCVILPGCHIITGQFGIQSSGSRETTYGGDGPESAGMVFFDRETFEREWAACKAQGGTSYTLRCGDRMLTVGELYEELEAAIASISKRMEITGGGTKLPSDYHAISPLEKVAYEITYDPLEYYPTSVVRLDFKYFPACYPTDNHEYERNFSCKQGYKRKWSRDRLRWDYSLQPQNEQADVKAIE